MAAPKLIPDELWTRFAAVDRRCDPLIDRRTQWPEGQGWTDLPDNPDPTRQRRAWRVRLTLRHDDPRYSGRGIHDDMIETDGLALADALTKAVDLAERRGWHLPPPPPA